MGHSFLKEGGKGFEKGEQETRIRLGTLTIGPHYRIAEENAAYSPITTSSDYAKFLGELARPTLVSDRLAVGMKSPGIGVREVLSWGLGIGIQDGSLGQVLWHGGFNAMGAFSSLALLRPEGSSGMVIFAAGPGAASVLRDLALRGRGGNSEGYGEGLAR